MTCINMSAKKGTERTNSRKKVICDHHAHILIVYDIM